VWSFGVVLFPALFDDELGFKYLAPYFGPLIFIFSNKVSGTGG